MEIITTANMGLLNCNLQPMKLSILMPVYNERTVVERCISLVLDRKSVV